MPLKNQRSAAIQGSGSSESTARQSPLRVIYVTLLLFSLTVFLGVLYGQHRAKKARNLLAVFHRNTATHFFMLQEDYEYWQDRIAQTAPHGQTRPALCVTGWEMFLKNSLEWDTSEVADFQIGHANGLTIFHVQGKNSRIERFVVAVPNDELVGGNYLAIGIERLDLQGKTHRRLLSYSRSAPNRIYVADVSGPVDLSSTLLAVTASYDWSTAFSPPPTEWTSFYPLRTDRGTVGVLESR